MKSRSMLTIALIALVVMGVIILYQCNRTKPDTPQTVTRIDTARQAPVVIYNMQPSGVTQAPTLPPINLSGMDSAKLRMMLEEYLQKYRELFAAHNAVNRYDTTFKDSLYKESLSMEVYQNRLSKFTRNMEVYNRTTTTTNPARFALLGGGFGYSDGLHTAAGFQLSAQTVKGDIYSVGYDLLNKGWYGSVQFKIKLRK